MSMATKRASSQRSRAGCRTCKIRHVRCDETNPACFKCTSTGRTCDGYLDSPTRRDGALQKHFQKPVDTSISLQLPHMISPIYSLPFKVPGSQKERQILHHYCVQGAFDLSGCMNPEFWVQSLLLTSHHEPAVRYALVALSSAKLFFESNNNSTGDRQVGCIPEVQALYVKALRQLRKYIAQHLEPSKTIVLQCCILFYCFEVARGDPQAALQHLQNGFSILQTGSAQKLNPNGRDAKSIHKTDEGLDEIQEVMIRLDLQASLYDNSRVPLFQGQAGMGRIVMRFETVSQARSLLDNLMNQFSNFLMENSHYREEYFNIPVSILERKHELGLRIQRWKLAYDAFSVESTASRLKVPARDQMWSMQLLEIHYDTLELFLKSAFPLNPGVFGKFPNSPIEDIFRKVEDLLAGFEERGGHRRIFSAETGVIAPLFLIAMKATDPALSSRAVQLLLSCNRREGLYDSNMVTRVILNLQQKRKTTGNSASLESDVVNIANLPGGLGTMAAILGVSQGN